MPSIERKSAIFGCFLLLIGLIIITSGKQSEKTALARNFSDEPVDVSSFANEEATEEKVPNQIIVPSVGIDLPVIASPIENGYWKVYDESAGWGVGSGIPGEEGNQVIFAHAQDGLFGTLDEVEVGDNIYTLTDDEWFSYQISEIFEVYPNEVRVIENVTNEEVLTLYTCSGFSDQKRLIVKAIRDSSHSIAK